MCDTLMRERKYYSMISQRVILIFTLYLQKYIAKATGIKNDCMPFLNDEDIVEIDESIRTFVVNKNHTYPVVNAHDQNEFIGRIIDILEDFIDDRQMSTHEEIHIKDERYDDIADALQTYLVEQHIFD